jgi:hypothetical protein
MGHLLHEPCAGLTRASMMRFHCGKVHGLPDPGNDELTAQSYDIAAEKDHGILIGGIDVDFRF